MSHVCCVCVQASAQNPRVQGTRVLQQGLQLVSGTHFVLSFNSYLALSVSVNIYWALSLSININKF